MKLSVARPCGRPFGRRLWLPLVGALVSFLAPLRAEPRPGDKIEPRVGSGTLEIVFRYCPEGKHVFITLDGSETVEKEPRKGFWISETEVSQKVFFDLLSQLDKQAKSGKLKIRGPAGDADEYKKQMSTRSPEASDENTPIFGLNITDATLFCHALSELQPVGPIKYKYRLPTRREWQYACRGVEDPGLAKKSPYFHKWDEMTEADKKRIEIAWNYLAKDWEKANPGKTFDGSQSQTFGLLRSKGGVDMNKVLEYITFVLKKSLGFDYNFETTTGAKLRRVDQGDDKTNWGCRNMHGNVSEWLSDGNWDALIAGNPSDLIYLGGGNFRLKPATLSDAPERFAMGGEFKPIWGEASSPGEESVNYIAGIRVVIDSEEPNVGPWLRFVRASALKDASAADRETWDRGLADLKRVKRTDEEVDSATAGIDFYTALVYLRGRDETRARKYLADWVGGTRKLAIGPKVNPKDVKARLASLAEQRKDLEAATPSEAARISPKLSLYKGMLHRHAGDPAAASRALDEWRLAVSRSTFAGRPPSEEWLREHAEELGDLEAGYLAHAGPTDKGAADRLERAVRGTQAMAYVRAGMIDKADQELAKSPAKAKGADALYNAGLRRLIRAPGK